MFELFRRWRLWTTASLEAMAAAVDGLRVVMLRRRVIGWRKAAAAVRHAKALTTACDNVLRQARLQASWRAMLILHDMSADFEQRSTRALGRRNFAILADVIAAWVSCCQIDCRCVAVRGYTRLYVVVCRSLCCVVM